MADADSTPSPADLESSPQFSAESPREPTPTPEFPPRSPPPTYSTIINIVESEEPPQIATKPTSEPEAISALPPESSPDSPPQSPLPRYSAIVRLPESRPPLYEAYEIPRATARDNTIHALEGTSEASVATARDRILRALEGRPPPPAVPTIPPVVSIIPPVTLQRRFDVGMNDPTYKLLPVALAKYHIENDWWQYDLWIMSEREEDRCLGYYERPMVLMKQMRERGERPQLVLRKIQGRVERPQIFDDLLEEPQIWV